jgi:hypothetical protein
MVPVLADHAGHLYPTPCTGLLPPVCACTQWPVPHSLHLLFYRPCHACAQWPLPHSLRWCFRRPCAHVLGPHPPCTCALLAPMCAAGPADLGLGPPTNPGAGADHALATYLTPCTGLLPPVCACTQWPVPHSLHLLFYRPCAQCGPCRIPCAGASGAHATSHGP